MQYYIKRAIDRYQTKGLLAVLVGIKNVIARALIPIYPRCVMYWLLRGRTLHRCDIGWYLRNVRTGDQMYMPDLATVRNHSPNRYDRMSSIYYPDMLDDLDERDTVVDIGAYIGRSSIIPAETGATVYAVESSPRNRKPLERNVADYDNIEIVPYAVWNESGTLVLNFGNIAGDDSLLNPDSGAAGSVSDVEARTVDDIAAEYGIGTIDVLKIEAEGAEPEVVEGIGDTPIRRIACNCGPERDGETTHDGVAAQLREDGWSVTVNASDFPYPMVYASNHFLG